ncbi:MAG TPA: hypothetical protein PKG52_05445 [bacterium]|nr:hypothetical protein [bacterium]HPS29714.1 hypothetical protein [bacterium]
MTDFKSPVLWVLLLSALIAFFYIVIKSFSRSFPKYGLKKSFSKESAAIFEALVDSHFRNNKDYLNHLKKLASEYPDEPMFFLFAGDIARKFNPEKALEIHRDILFRPSTTGKLRALVLKHIGEDYLALRQYSKAISVLKDSVKTADSPEARFLMSRVYEKEKNYVNALEEIDRFVSLTEEKESTLPLKMISKAVIYYYQKNSMEDYKYWLEYYIKRTSSEPEKNLAHMKLMLLKEKPKKSISYLQTASADTEKYELAARAMILNEKEGLEINSSVEGHYKAVFDALLNTEPKDPAIIEQINGKSLLFYRLTAKYSAKSTLRDVVISDFNYDTLFACSECGNPVEASFPLCRHCLAITGRKLNTISGD